MGGQGKGGARARFLPPARSSRPPSTSDGPTITEKIKARRASGGAEAWDDFKARIASKQKEEFAAENVEVVMSAQHRAVLDREREMRLAGLRPPEDSDSRAKPSKREKEKHKRKRKSSESDRHKDKKHKHKADKKRRKKERKSERAGGGKGGDSESSSSGSDEAAAPSPTKSVTLEAQPSSATLAQQGE
ncbi:hypothetical protein AB1Y20_012154 [Prymnesium parvum]|uniref:ADP-ribosylation factor-like protein 6-interacting protein 4 n=1 Tax=Prymnesium parvum TaxID=97485 RepID=A0AB34IQ44_PRYPA